MTLTDCFDHLHVGAHYAGHGLGHQLVAARYLPNPSWDARGRLLSRLYATFPRIWPAYTELSTRYLYHRFMVHARGDPEMNDRFLHLDCHGELWIVTLLLHQINNKYRLVASSLPFQAVSRSSLASVV
jgi:hypothetical protein